VIASGARGIYEEDLRIIYLSKLYMLETTL
jgi:hypothetical protein